MSNALLRPIEVKKTRHKFCSLAVGGNEKIQRNNGRTTTTIYAPTSIRVEATSSSDMGQRQRKPLESATRFYFGEMTRWSNLLILVSRSPEYVSRYATKTCTRMEASQGTAKFPLATVSRQTCPHCWDRDHACGARVSVVRMRYREGITPITFPTGPTAGKVRRLNSG